MDLRARLDMIEIVIAKARRFGHIDVDVSELIDVLIKGADEDLQLYADPLRKWGVTLLWHDPHA